MANLNQWNRVLAVSWVLVAMVIASDAQILTTLANTPGDALFMSLTQGLDGNFYGVTQSSGLYGYGTIFSVTPQGQVTTLYSFCSQQGCSDGDEPIGTLLLQSDNGGFYGTTFGGGSDNNGGTIFEISPAGAFKTIHRFCEDGNGCPDGDQPYDGLIQSATGDFYGTTYGGGAIGEAAGTVFKISPKGVLTTVHVFEINQGGYEPIGGLLQSTDGNLYGTTSGGGPRRFDCGNGCGTIYQLTAGGRFRTVHQFQGFQGTGDGSTPRAGLTQALDGSFYGATSQGGDLSCTFGGDVGCGTIFQLAPDGTLTILHTFEGTDGSAADMAPIQATDGNIYGTTNLGGAGLDCQNGYDGCGTIYQITSNGEFTKLYDFCTQGGQDCPDGWLPNGLIQGTDGKFYGTTTTTVFSLDMGLGPFVAFVRPFGTIGKTVGVLGQGFTGTTAVSVSGIPASFTVKSDTFLEATVPAGATTGYVTVITPSGTLTSNVPFHVIP